MEFISFDHELAIGSVIVTRTTILYTYGVLNGVLYMWSRQNLEIGNLC
jgi:hypothetical protein